VAEGRFARPRDEQAPPRGRGTEHPRSDTLSADVARASDGDLDAFGRLVEALRPRLLASIERRTSRMELHGSNGEDILHDSIVSAILTIDRFRADGIRGFWGWLLAIALNQIRYRRRRAETWWGVRKYLAFDAASTAEVPGRESLARASVLASLPTLPHRHRRVILPRDVLGLDWREVAFMLDRGSIDAARRHHARARSRMAERLKARIRNSS